MRTDVDAELPKRRRAFGITAVVFGLVFGAGLFGWLGLFASWFGIEDRLAHRTHDIAGGIMNGLIIPVGFFAVAARPRNVGALHQIAVLLVAGLIAAAMAADALWLVFVAIPAVALAVVLAVAGPAYRRRFLRPERHPSPVLAVLPAIAIVPATAFALTMARFQREGVPMDEHVNEHHWTAMAVLAVGLVLLGFLGSLRMPGWRVVTRTTAAATMVFGLASVRYPSDPGSAGDTWGLVMLVVGAIYLGLAEWEAKKDRG